MHSDRLHLKPRTTQGAQVFPLEAQGWHLEIPAGPPGSYRLAQLDDYTGAPRRQFPWNPPLRLTIEAKVGDKRSPGTWGFGLWNDPFGFGLGHGAGLRLPALPHCTWFFFASEANYLSLRDDLPANGDLAAAFQSRTVPPAAQALGLPLLALGIFPVTARYLRRLLRHFISQEAVQLVLDTSQLHCYQIDWTPDWTRFYVDQVQVAEALISPQGPLGLVIWIDNQYAAFRPDGAIRSGTLENRLPAWLEICRLDVSPL